MRWGPPACTAPHGAGTVPKPGTRFNHLGHSMLRERRKKRKSLTEHGRRGGTGRVRMCLSTSLDVADKMAHVGPEKERSPLLDLCYSFSCSRIQRLEI